MRGSEVVNEVQCDQALAAHCAPFSREGLGPQREGLLEVAHIAIPAGLFAGQLWPAGVVNSSVLPPATGRPRRRLL